MVSFEMIIPVVFLWNVVNAWLPSSRNSPRHSFPGTCGTISHLSATITSPPPHCFVTITGQSRRYAKSKGEEDDEDKPKQWGMTDAFRRLDSLESLGEEPKINLDDLDSQKAAWAETSAPVPTPEVAEATPEKEIEVYKNMVNELEDSSEGDLYVNVMEEMGGIPNAPSEIKGDLGDSAKIDLTRTDENGGVLTEEFMNEAFKQALDEVNTKNTSVVDSILDDKEIMNEIEAIFDRGTAQLVESLEQIRTDQQEMAKQKAKKTAEQAVDYGGDEAKRLEATAKSMEAMLQKVDKESEEVKLAARELEEVKTTLDNDFILKLKSGGILKQGSLAGLILFSVRSIVDTVTALNTSNESLMASALIQAVVAVVFAVLLFVL